MRTRGALLALLLAAFGLLGLGTHRNAQKAVQVAGSPILKASRSFSFNPPFNPSRNVSGNINDKLDARSLLGQLPLMFEPNQGQADAGVKFLARGAGYNLFLDATGATLGMRAAPDSRPRQSEHIVRMKLLGANRAAAMKGTGLLPGKSNYFVGNDPHQWHSDIPQFAEVHYDKVYPGIDLVFYGKQGHLEYDFRVAPGADPAQAELQFEGATKAEMSGGDLILTGVDDGGLRLRAPQIYQTEGDRRQPVAGRFVLRANNRVGFEIGPYDRSRELVIDPVLQFSTYFGGGGSETSPSVAVNGDGNVYMVGTTTSSSGFPTTLTPTQIGPGANIFVAKIAPSQPAAVIYLTFLGGSATDSSVGLAVDGGGNAYIAGNTASTNFPTAGVPYQTGPSKTQCTVSPTCTSVFVSALNPQGSRLNYSTYLSGNGNDQASGMTIDSNRDVFVTGVTSSTDTPSQTDEFPASNLPVPYQTSSKASLQFFVTEVNTNAPGTASVPYSTYFGGGPVTGGTVAIGGGIAVDPTGNIYFSGTTNFYNSGLGQFGNSNQTTDFPILNSYQPCLDTPPPTVLSNPNPCTAPGGSPYPNDAFVAKLNPNNAQTGIFQLIFSTYLGGTAADSSTGIALDSGAANIYVTGTTNSSDFILPTGITPFQSCLDTPPPTLPPCPSITSGATDAYVARMTNPTAVTTGTPLNVALTYFSYLGGSGNETGNAIAVDTSPGDTANDAFITGATNSTNFPVTSGAIQSTLNGAQNAFFAHIDTTTVTGQNGIGSYSTYFGGNGTDRGTGIAVDPVTLNTFFAGDTTSTNLQTQAALQTTLNGASDAFVAELVPAPDVTVAPTVTTTQAVSAGNQLTEAFTVTNLGPDLATGIYVNGAVSSTDVVFNSATAGSGSCSGVVSNAVVCTIPTLQVGSTSTVSFIVTASRTGAYEATASVFKINNTNTNLTANTTFTAGGFSMSITPSSQSVLAGQTAQYMVQLSPQGPFGANVSLTCSGVPAGTACNFSSNTVTFAGGTSSASAALNLTTTPQPVTAASAGTWRSPMYALWLVLPGMALLGLGGGKRFSSRWLGLFVLPMLLGLLLLLPSCSSGKTLPQVSGTPSGTYSMTVTATSGTFSQTVPFQVTVSP
jgi:hypothetical protein